MRIGYIRVGTINENAVHQLEDIDVERTFADKTSGHKPSRPALAEMIAFVREGDTVFVDSMARLARNLDELRRLVHTLTGKGVRAEFVKERLAFTGKDSAMANLLLSMMGAFAEFERALIPERQRDGIAAAKTRGVYTGRKPALTSEQAQQLRDRAAAGEPKAALAKDFGISRGTVYNYLRADAAKKVVEPPITRERLRTQNTEDRTPQNSHTAPQSSAAPEKPAGFASRSAVTTFVADGSCRTPIRVYRLLFCISVTDPGYLRQPTRLGHSVRHRTHGRSPTIRNTG